MYKEILSILACLLVIYFIRDIVTAIIVLCVVSFIIDYISRVNGIE